MRNTTSHYVRLLLNIYASCERLALQVLGRRLGCKVLQTPGSEDEDFLWFLDTAWFRAFKDNE